MTRHWNSIDTLPSEKPNTREAMIAYLAEHFRYRTDNYGYSHSYAHCVKLRHLNFPSQEVEERAYDLLYLEGPEPFCYINAILAEFEKRHNREWSISFNGRSDGYLVLYHSPTSGLVNMSGVDMEMDYEEWEDDDLRDRVDLVWDFDQTVRRAVDLFIHFAEEFKVVEEEVQVTRTVRVPVRIEESEE